MPSPCFRKAPPIKRSLLSLWPPTADGHVFHAQVVHEVLCTKRCLSGRVSLFLLVRSDLGGSLSPMKHGADRARGNEHDQILHQSTRDDYRLQEHHGCRLSQTNKLLLLCMSCLLPVTARCCWLAAFILEQSAYWKPTPLRVGWLHDVPTLTMLVILTLPQTR